MAWDQGPYPALEGCVTPIRLNEASRVIREQGIDCVYSLFQVYHPKLWGPPRDGAEHDVWTLLRALLLERQRGAFDAPIVRHWGFDVQQLDSSVARALDAHVFCNREQLAYWSEPVRRGGCGLDVFSACDVTAFLDSDRPKQEFMNDDFSPRLSDRDGEIHTVCVGRPFAIDYLAAARLGIHVHVYSNSVNEAYESIARDVPLSGVRKWGALLRRFVHVHPSLQPLGASWAEVRAAKARWVGEFSKYDAGWSYIGSPLPWAPREDRAAIPNRLSTYLLAGLPIITDQRPGFHRYDELVRLGVNVDLVDSDYGALRQRLEGEVRSRTLGANARTARSGYSFDATIEPLLAVLERARASYFARPQAERSRFREGDRRRIVHFDSTPAPAAVFAGLVRRLAPPADPTSGEPGRLARIGQAARVRWRRLVAGAKARVLAPRLRAWLDRDTGRAGPGEPR
jgi:hypothetical protein